MIACDPNTLVGRKKESYNAPPYSNGGVALRACQDEIVLKVHVVNVFEEI